MSTNQAAKRKLPNSLPVKKTGPHCVSTQCINASKGGAPTIERTVVALGGNAILQRAQKGTFEEQLASVRKTVASLVDLIVNGHDIVITHGNGPQIGNLLNQNEWAKDETPPMPLDVLGSQTQGMIGYMLQQSLGNELRRRGIDRPVVTLLTRVEVDPNDPAFGNPTKFVGPFLSEERAQQLMLEKGYVIKKDVDRGWRRVVPSPMPIRLVEADVIAKLVDSKVLVIASGAGGIPVVANPAKGNRHIGIEAVVDKDLSSTLLAKAVNAQTLIIVTDVNHISLNYGTRDKVDLREVDVDTMSNYLEEGHFAPGSMGPKVRAAISFVRESGGQAIITSLGCVTDAIEGRIGTRIVPSGPITTHPQTSEHLVSR